MGTMHDLLTKEEFEKDEEKRDLKHPPIETVFFEDLIEVCIDDLLYDIGNLRLAHRPRLNEKNIEQALATAKEFHIAYLVIDIKERGLQESLILYPRSNKVIEGNRRLCALKILSKIAQISETIANADKDVVEGLKKEFLEKYQHIQQFEELIDPTDTFLQDFQKMQVPCMQIDKRSSQESIFAYLTSIHIARKDPWQKYNRAKMLRKLHQNGYSYKAIAKIARVSRSTATREVETFYLHEEYRKLHPEDEDWVGKFYYFWEILGSKGKKFRKNQNNIHNFMSLVAAGAYDETKNVRELLNALENTEQTSFTQAELGLLKFDDSKYKPNFKSAHYTKIGQTTKFLDYITREEINLAVNEPERRKFLERLYNSCEKVLDRIDRKRDN